MEGTDRQHEVRPAVGCAAGCAGTSDLLSRCGWLLWRVGWVCCFKGASHFLVLTWLWPLSCSCLFGPTLDAAAVLVPLSICAVFSWGQSVRVPGDLGPFYWGVVPACRIHCTCLSVFPFAHTLCLPCLLWTVQSLNSVVRSASRSSLCFRSTNIQNGLG